MYTTTVDWRLIKLTDQFWVCPSEIASLRAMERGDTCIGMKNGVDLVVKASIEDVIKAMNEAIKNN